jgi:hypothetical protein
VQINQRGADIMMHADQKDTGAAINPNKMKIDFKFPIAEFKNSSKFKIGSEIENIFNFNSNAGKLNKELYLVFRLHTAISVQKKNIYGDFSGSIANLILQI